MTLADLFCPPIPESWKQPPRVIHEPIGERLKKPSKAMSDEERTRRQIERQKIRRAGWSNEKKEAEREKDKKRLKKMRLSSSLDY